MCPTHEFGMTLPQLFMFISLLLDEYIIIKLLNDLYNQTYVKYLE
jgi:hypothetical protein